MARAPFQVLVFPYRTSEDIALEYAVFRRADAGFWQAVAGGGEDGETPLEAAQRETYEETGLPPDSPFLQLATVSPVPVIAFSESHLWGDDLLVIPEYCFGVLARDGRIALSCEHTEVRWVTYQEARQLLKYDSNRIALWELNRRLQGLRPRD